MGKSEMTEIPTSFRRAKEVRAVLASLPIGRARKMSESQYMQSMRAAYGQYRDYTGYGDVALCSAAATRLCKVGGTVPPTTDAEVLTSILVPLLIERLLDRALGKAAVSPAETSETLGQDEELAVRRWCITYAEQDSREGAHRTVTVTAAADSEIAAINWLLGCYDPHDDLSVSSIASVTPIEDEEVQRGVDN